MRILQKIISAIWVFAAIKKALCTAVCGQYAINESF